MMPIITLAMSALAFADVGPDYSGSCYCCGGGAILLLVGLVFLLDRMER
jgi:hypothetical protein